MRGDASPQSHTQSSSFFIEVALLLHALEMNFITHSLVNTSNAHYNGDAALAVLWKTHDAELGSKKNRGGRTEMLGPMGTRPTYSCHLKCPLPC